MRIRRRPPVCLSQLDPSVQVNPPNTNGRSGGTAAGVGGGLHPVEDLQIHHPLQINFPVSLSDPYPDQLLPARRHQLQGVKEEEEGRRVDSNEGCNAWASSCCGSSRYLNLPPWDKWQLGCSPSSGAVQAGETVALLKKTAGGSSYGNGSVGSTSMESKPPVMELQEKEDRAKVRVLKGRATSAIPSPSPAVSVLDNNCTSNSIGSGGSNTNSGGKRRKSPCGVMEGSRCSRVNGRGWRCCQQTLVGYSLCEHHLGKGRLRSMSSSAATVRGQLGTSKPKWRTNLNGAIPPTTNSVPSKQALEEDEEKPLSTVLVANGADKVEEDKAITTRKTSWKKTSAVKARSISSLLDDTNQDHHSPQPSAPSQAPQVAPSIDQ